MDGCVCKLRNYVCDSPNTVLGFFLSDTIIGVVYIDNQIPIVVMGRLKVGDHPAGDAQQTHHWNQTQRFESIKQAVINILQLPQAMLRPLIFIFTYYNIENIQKNNSFVAKFEPSLLKLIYFVFFFCCCI